MHDAGEWISARTAGKDGVLGGWIVRRKGRAGPEVVKSLPLRSVLLNLVSPPLFLTPSLSLVSVFKYSECFKTTRGWIRSHIIAVRWNQDWPGPVLRKTYGHLKKVLSLFSADDLGRCRPVFSLKDSLCLENGFSSKDGQFHLQIRNLVFRHPHVILVQDYQVG